MNHLQQYLVEEFVEDYKEGYLSRREALRRLAGIIGATAAAQLLAACGQPAQQAPAATAAPAATEAPAPTEAPAATAAPAATEAPAATAAASPAPAGASPNSVAPDDPAIIAERVEFPGQDATLIGYLARPAAGEDPAPIVLVCHENRGLTPHIEDVTRRVAKAGYVGLAVDLLSREGGTAQVSDAASIPGLLSGAPPERHVQDFVSGLNFLKAQPYAQADRAGMVGFCFGGGVTWLVAANVPELRAAVPFYGPPPPAEQLPNVKAAVLAIYAENDQRINQSIPAVEAAMQQSGVTFKKIIYPGVDHAFHNDTGQRYNAEAAQAAWAETLAWFEQHLRGA
ncbi:MAG TPA: dienelactone hydrolase family protein [Roseiflexaceae bacterium]|nr:dienelactone hydrolase family protein [Roseiflexaceae bacterium]